MLEIAARAERAAAYPASAGMSRIDQRCASSASGRVARIRAGLSGFTSTSNESRLRERPTPCAFRKASLQVQQRKKAATRWLSESARRESRSAGEKNLSDNF